MIFVGWEFVGVWWVRRRRCGLGRSRRERVDAVARISRLNYGCGYY